MPPAERAREVTAALDAGDTERVWSLVAEHVTMWGRAGAKASRHTLRAYRSGMRAFLAFAGAGAATVLDPNPDLGATYLRSLERAGKSPATVNNRRAAAGALYRALRWSTATTADPFRDVPAVRDPTARHEKRRPYSPRDMERMLAAADASERRMLQLGARGGLRVAEMARLDWKDVDLPARKLRVVMGKGGKTRTVDIYHGLQAELDAVPAEDRTGPVLPWRRPESIRARLERVCDRAGVTYLGVHSLRHYCGTELYRLTGRLDVAQQQLGHSNIATTQVYAKWADEMSREYLDKF